MLERNGPELESPVSSLNTIAAITRQFENAERIQRRILKLFHRESGKLADQTDDACVVIGIDFVSEDFKDVWKKTNLVVKRLERECVSQIRSLAIAILTCLEN